MTILPDVQTSGFVMNYNETQGHERVRRVVLASEQALLLGRGAEEDDATRQRLLATGQLRRDPEHP